MPNESVTWRSSALSQHLAALSEGNTCSLDTCFDMTLLLLLFVGLATVLALGAYRLNKTFYVMAFFARRVRTKDGRPVESIAPVAESRTIFGNSFDMSDLDDIEFFRSRQLAAQKIGRSYVQYVMGVVSYVIIEAELFEWIVNNRDLMGKGLVYQLMEPALGLGLLTSSGQKWHSHRKMLTPSFHFSILEQFMEVFKAESLKFVKQFEGEAEASISLSKLIPRFTLNTICETAMGIKLDDMAEKGDRYRKSFSQIEKSVVKRVRNPFYWNNTIYNVFGAREDKQCIKVVREFSRELVAKRRKLLELESKDKPTAEPDQEDDIYMKRKQRFAMLDTLIFAERDGLIDHDGICEQVNTLMFAGFDTTSNALKFTLMNMGMYQEQQELCYQEICEHIPGDMGSLESSRLSNLKYLECFIKETLRLYPSAPTIGRVTTEELEFVNGLILPARSEIILSIFNLHRNPKYWTEPNKFDPERFLPENSRNRHNYAYMPFSSGARNCIGKKYAMLQMKTFLSIVLKQFKILSLLNPEDLVLHSGITLGCTTDIRVKLVRRR